MTCEARASSAFDKAFSSLHPGLRHKVFLRVWDLVRRYENSVPLENRQVRKVEGLRGDAWRAKVDDAHRLLYSWDGKALTLLMVGGHHITETYTDQQLRRDLTSASSNSRFIQQLRDTKPHFFGNVPDRELELLTAAELVPEWVHYLDHQQTAILESLVDAAEAQVKSRNSSFHVIVGGPGTGKTSLLVSLLDLMRLCPDLELTLRMQDHVRRYIETGLPYSLDRYQAINEGGFRPRLSLIDDPRGASDIMSVAETAFLAQAQMVVVAFDPLQLEDTMSDYEYDRFLKLYSVREHRLTAAYRQKENVGRAAKRVIDSVARSTPFLDETKILAHHEQHSKLTRFCNEQEFRNPRGYEASYGAAGDEALEYELHRLLDDVSLLWKHWPPLLVIFDEYVGEPGRRRIRDTIGAVWPAQLPAPEYADLHTPREIKGTEFQHVFLFLTEDTYAQIEHGFRGSGKATYAKRRLLRIPFTRAKDSICTFVLPDDGTPRTREKWEREARAGKARRDR